MIMTTTDDRLLAKQRSIIVAMTAIFESIAGVATLGLALVWLWRQQHFRAIHGDQDRLHNLDNPQDFHIDVHRRYDNQSAASCAKIHSSLVFH